MSYEISLPARPRLDFYKKLAKELLRVSSDTSAKSAVDDAAPDAVRAWAERWLKASGSGRAGATQAHAGTVGERSPVAERAEWMERRWQELRKSKGNAPPLLADAQFFLAREHGFPSWPKFAEHLRALENVQSTVTKFETAVDAVVAGDERILAELLQKDSSLVRARSLREHHSTLLHYCSANGVEDYRQKTPANIVAIARILLDAGAEVNAASNAYGGGSTTLMLTATSVHPERAGVQIPLLELLLERGAAIDVGKSSDVAMCLRNGRVGAAEFLSKKGARLDLEGAAGVGLLDRVKEFFAEDGRLKAGATPQQLADGLAWTCEFGRQAIVGFLLEHGVRADMRLRADGLTPLHWAALGGHTEIVRMLLARGADVNARETSFDGTPVGWAVYGWNQCADAEVKERYYQVVGVLVAAGAEIGALASLDRRMMAALLGKSS
jgi:ankyrin repeat protein